MARKPMYSFAEKRHSKRGITASVLGGVSFLIFCVLAYLSFYFRGQGGQYLGAIGLTAMIMSFSGLILGFLSLTEKNSISFFSEAWGNLKWCYFSRMGSNIFDWSRKVGE